MSEGVKEYLVWENFRLGNQKALEYIYEANYSSLYYYGLKFQPDSNLVKDTIQELFIDLINSGKGLAQTDNIRFYLLKALRNKLLKQIKKQLSDVSEDLEQKTFSLQDSVENQLVAKEVAEEVKGQIISAIKKLSSKQQEIIYLRFYNDVPYTEIAEIFSTKVQTVRNLMNRAINSLRDDLKQKGIEKHFILFLLKLSI